MVKCRGAAESAAKWKTNVGHAGPAYEAGILNPKRDWATETAKAEARWEDGVRKAAADKRFGKGVQAAGTSKWQENAKGKGVDRWGAGVQLAGPAYEAGIGKVIGIIERTNLPPRYAAGDPRNNARTIAMNKAVHDGTKGA